MKSNPPLPNLAKQDFIHECGFIPTEADLIKKDCNFVSKLQSFFGGGWWIRTTEVDDNRFTVCPLWPLGKSPILWVTVRDPLELVIGVEPTTC